MLSAFLLRTRRVPERETLGRIFRRCFSSSDGQQVLEHLHRQFVFRTTDPRLSEAELRFLEGQRQAVLYLCTLAASPSTSPSSHS